MEDEKYIVDFNSFMLDHPELDPKWKPVVEPAVLGSEKELQAFILSHIFM